MTHNRLSNFCGVCTIIQIVHIKFITVALADYSGFRSSSKMTEEQVAAAASQGKREKKGVYVKAWLKRRKNLELYGTLLAELQLEQEYNYNILL